MGTKCKDKNATQTIKGRVMLNCTTPYANGLLRLKGDIGFAPKFCEDEFGNREFYTDSNGYFEFKYIFNGYDGTLYAPYEALDFIPIDDELVDIGELNLNGKINFIIRLQANNSYGIYDTLQIPDFDNFGPNGIIRIPGPFVSGDLDTIVNWGYIHYPIKYNKNPKYWVNYFFMHQQSGITFDAPFNCGTSDYSIATIIIN